jgi:hypothetical protein
MYLKYHKAGLTSSAISPVNMSIGRKSFTNLRRHTFPRSKPYRLPFTNWRRKKHVQPCLIQMWPKVTCSSEYVPLKCFRMVIWKQQIILKGDYGFYFWTENLFVRNENQKKNCGLATISSIFSGKNSHFQSFYSSHCLAVDDFFRIYLDRNATIKQKKNSISRWQLVWSSNSLIEMYVNCS